MAAHAGSCPFAPALTVTGPRFGCAVSPGKPLGPGVQLSTARLHVDSVWGAGTVPMTALAMRPLSRVVTTVPAVVERATSSPSAYRTSVPASRLETLRPDGLTPKALLVVIATSIVSSGASVTRRLVRPFSVSSYAPTGLMVPAQASRVYGRPRPSRERVWSNVV